MKKVLKRIFAVLLIMIGGLIAISALSNINLPTQSKVVNYLSDGDKARLAEFFHLRQRLGNQVWPGWGDSDSPVILHNEAYAFLINFDGQPPKGWIKVPLGELRGGEWEEVRNDQFLGQVYYRQPITDPEKTPENFTVLVGDQWVATLQTYEFAAIDFYDGFKDQLPGFLRPIFPYRLFWSLLIPNSEAYIGALAHESFHSVQGVSVADRLSQAEEAAVIEGSYPWEGQAVTEAWQIELDLLFDAVNTDDLIQKKELAQQFLAQRNQRRETLGFSEEHIAYEKEREWLEGLAKYAELALQLEASQNSDYAPAPQAINDPDFDNYSRTERYFSQQVTEVTRMASQGGETRFYYTGLCIGLLLDELAPDWKNQIFSSGVYLEDLLAVAIQ